MSRDGPAGFLALTPWRGSASTPLAGDASARRYLRLGSGPRPALLMIAPPETCGPLDPFVEMTAHLRGLGLRAPEIFARDAENGFLLLEDFGDDLLAHKALATPEAETALYERATDVLLVLHGAAGPDVPVLGPHELAAMLEPLFTHYAPGFAGGAAVIATLTRMLEELPPWQPTLALRDYHAENLIVLDAGAGPQSLGLLDYQDAVLTHPAYDLASLLQDARRTLPLPLETAMLHRFQAGTGLDASGLLSGFRLIALQRNLRILGIFARLMRERPTARYTSFQPIVWRHVQRMLATPDGAPLAALLSDLPPPETGP